MIFEEHELAGAVFLFSGNSSGAKELIRELNYAEFEAVLDRYVPAIDLAGCELYGAYCEINSRLKLKKAVFFMVSFDSSGFVEKGWSLPLFRLAAHARKGPDLGAGPIDLACASHCPIAHLAAFLWNPNLKSKHEFKAIIEAVQRNRMGIMFKDLHPESKRKEHQEAEDKKDRVLLEKSISSRLRKEYDKEFRNKIAQTLREQRMHAATIALEREQAIAEIKQQYNARIEEYRLMLDEHKNLLHEARHRNEVLKETIDGQALKIQGLREYFELKLEKAESIESDQLGELRHSHEMELHAALESATRDLNELLQMRDVEILYRKEQEAKLQKELAALRKANSGLMNNSGDHLLGSMLEKGISFVTYQPGAGHITLPISEISRFMENPTAYVAEHCGVSEAHYNAWLQHYHVPVCQSNDETSGLCGENINRIESPADFIIGESDCCHQHRKFKTPRLKLAGMQ